MSRITKCDNCGYNSIIEKTKRAICPNCGKHKLSIKNIDKRSNVICKLNDRKQFRVDGCIRDMVYLLNVNGIQTCGSCCGHNRYPLSIIYKTSHMGVETFYELISGVKIPRTRNFYVTDKDGFYYIPEALEELYGKMD